MLCLKYMQPTRMVVEVSTLGFPGSLRCDNSLKDANADKTLKCNNNIFHFYTSNSETNFQQTTTWKLKDNLHYLNPIES